jgi:hypothetical protein
MGTLRQELLQPYHWERRLFHSPLKPLRVNARARSILSRLMARTNVSGEGASSLIAGPVTARKKRINGPLGSPYKSRPNVR